MPDSDEYYGPCYDLSGGDINERKNELKKLNNFKMNDLTM